MGRERAGCQRATACTGHIAVQVAVPPIIDDDARASHQKDTGDKHDNQGHRRTSVAGDNQRPKGGKQQEQRACLVAESEEIGQEKPVMAMRARGVHRLMLTASR